MSPIRASLILWAAWVFSWLAASPWSRRTQARAAFLSEAGYRIPTVGGALILYFATVARAGLPLARRWYPSAWSLPDAADWICTALVAAGFVFCWWARLTLGDLWSSSVTRKEAHEIVRRGPYAIVRHPIYTGLSLSALALSAQSGRVLGPVGAALMILGFWLKARLEERFLAVELGPAYEAYRQTTPMLAPFWPAKR